MMTDQAMLVYIYAWVASILLAMFLEGMRAISERTFLTLMAWPAVLLMLPVIAPVAAVYGLGVLVRRLRARRP